MAEVEMTMIETGRFEGGLHTAAVFKDLEWARRGVEALRGRGFTGEAMSIVAKAADGVAGWAAVALGRPVPTLTIAGLGEVLGAGPFVEGLDGGRGDLGSVGLSGAIGRVGFQVHDGQIFEELVRRGGILVAIRSEPRAADALALFHSYGGANAAIGAWVGRV